MKREMKKGLVDLVLLSLVGRGGISGADLVVELQGLFPTGTIYPALGRLERSGLLVSHRRRASTGRIRKEYDLSPAGREELATLADEWDALTAAISQIRHGAPR